MRTLGQPIPAAPSRPQRREQIIARGVAVILTIALIYTLGYPLSLTWDLSRYFAFGQLHSLVFASNGLLLLLTLRWMAERPDIPRRFRSAGAMLVLAHAFTVLTAVMWVPAYTERDSILHPGMLTYVLILLLGNFSLMATVPWWTWPRRQVLQLIADTLLVMSVIDIALTVALPALVSSWTWSPALTAAVFRLETSLGLGFWYMTVYRRFGGFHHRALVPWALGIACLLATDATLLWGTLQMEQGRTDLLLGSAMPFWMVHQTMWSLGLFYVLGEVPSWRTALRAAPYLGRRLRWALSFRQGLALTVLAVIVSMAGSLRATVWFVGALLVSQIVGAYELGKEREELERANSRLRDVGVWQASVLEQRQTRAVEVAHDMGNLLQDVKLTAATIAARLSGDSGEIPADIQELLQTTDTSVDALDDMLTSMVAAARLDAGALRLNLAPTDIGALLSHTMQTLRTRAEQQRIALHLELPPATLLVVADAKLLNRALLNIAGNAIKFTGAARRDGGHVRVIARADEHGVTISVKDNGPGIQPADLERLGQRFVRGSDVPNTLAGFGLGLAFARGVIEQHPGGDFAIISTPGEGTTVTIHLAATPMDTAANNSTL